MYAEVVYEKNKCLFRMFIVIIKKASRVIIFTVGHILAQQIAQKHQKGPQIRPQ